MEFDAEDLRALRGIKWLVKEEGSSEHASTYKNIKNDLKQPGCDLIKILGRTIKLVEESHDSCLREITEIEQKRSALNALWRRIVDTSKEGFKKIGLEYMVSDVAKITEVLNQIKSFIEDIDEKIKKLKDACSAQNTETANAVADELVDLLDKRKLVKKCKEFRDVVISTALRKFTTTRDSYFPGNPEWRFLEKSLKNRFNHTIMYIRILTGIGGVSKDEKTTKNDGFGNGLIGRIFCEIYKKKRAEISGNREWNEYFEAAEKRAR